MPQTLEERIEEFLLSSDLKGKHGEIMLREIVRTTHNNAIQMAMGKVPKDLPTTPKGYDGNNLESACDAYNCAFTDWQEVIRYEQGNNHAITQTNKGLSELIIE